MNKVYKSHSRMLSYSSMKSTDANSKTIEQPESHLDQQLSSPRGVILSTAITPRVNRSGYMLEKFGSSQCGDTAGQSHGDIAVLHSDEVIQEEDDASHQITMKRKFKFAGSAKIKRKKSTKEKIVLNPYEKSLVSFIEMKNLYN